MRPSAASIKPLVFDSPAVSICARWRHDAFLEQCGFSLDDSYRQLVEVISQDDYEAALVAEVDDRPVGLCLFVRDELDAAHDLSPWLASLYVASGFRRRGIGRDLVAAIERHARHVGESRLYLYTETAESFYLRCGWCVTERFDWDGEPFVLMHRDL